MSSSQMMKVASHSISMAGDMLDKGYHMLKLPPPSVSLSSEGGRRLFGEALMMGTAMGSLQILQSLETQKESRSCGLASLAAALNALHVDPGVTFRGQGRWYAESMLEPSHRLEIVKQYGMSFKKLASVARQNKLEVDAFLAQNSSHEEFKRILSETTTLTNAYVIVNYNRDVLKQVGSAHFAPLAAYHGPSDMVLLLDVAKYKYPSHWVPSRALWDAINTTVQKTGETRGFMVVQRNATTEVDS